MHYGHFSRKKVQLIGTKVVKLTYNRTNEKPITIDDGGNSYLHCV